MPKKTVDFSGKVEVSTIAPLSLQFGREDMDAVVAKVNEIIKNLNG